MTHKLHRRQASPAAGSAKTIVRLVASTTLQHVSASVTRLGDHWHQHLHVHPASETPAAWPPHVLPVALAGPSPSRARVAHHRDAAAPRGSVAVRKRLAQQEAGRHRVTPLGAPWSNRGPTATMRGFDDHRMQRAPADRAGNRSASIAASRRPQGAEPPSTAMRSRTSVMSSGPHAKDREMRASPQASDTPAGFRAAMSARHGSRDSHAHGAARPELAAAVGAMAAIRTRRRHIGRTAVGEAPQPAVAPPAPPNRAARRQQSELSLTHQTRRDRSGARPDNAGSVGLLPAGARPQPTPDSLETKPATREPTLAARRLPAMKDAVPSALDSAHLDRLADDVMRRIERKLRIERERRGL